MGTDRNNKKKMMNIKEMIESSSSYKIIIFIGPWTFEITEKGIESNDDYKYKFPNTYYIDIDSENREAIIHDYNMKIVMTLSNIQIMKKIRKY